MKKHGKKYVEASNKVEKNKIYSIKEAIELVKATTITKFDSTIDVTIKTNIDSKKSDQAIRGSLVLPNGTGKTKRILVLATGDAAKSSEEAGAQFVGGKELIEKIEKENWFEFDVIIATPEMMPLLGKIGKILGPKGLMPNPKTGTVTTNPAAVVADVNKGMISYKNDSYGNIHSIIGKSSFTDEKLEENLLFFVNNITKNKPSTLKGKFISKISISSTMGPGITVDTNSFDI